MQISSLFKQTVFTVTIGCLMLAPPLNASDFMTVYTPKKTEITGYLFKDASSEEINDRDQTFENIIKEAGWNVKKIDTSSSTYNGHGYAWHMSDGGAAVVIGSDDVQWYWMDGSYKEIDEDEAGKGDIIYMTDPDDPANTHSAVVSDQPGWCKSKWGDGPLILHKYDEHPFGKSFKFYRKAAPPAPQNLRIKFK